MIFVKSFYRAPMLCLCRCILLCRFCSASRSRIALTVAASSQQYNLAQQSHSAIFAAKTQFSGKSTV